MAAYPYGSGERSDHMGHTIRELYWRVWKMKRIPVKTLDATTYIPVRIIDPKASFDVSTSQYDTIEQWNQPADIVVADAKGSSHLGNQPASPITRPTAARTSVNLSANESGSTTATDTTIAMAMSKSGQKDRTSQSSNTNMLWSRNSDALSGRENQSIISMASEMITGPKTSNSGSEQSDMGRGQKKSNVPTAVADTLKSEATEAPFNIVTEAMKYFEFTPPSDEWMERHSPENTVPGDE